MKLLTKEPQESYENTKVCYIYKAKFKNKYLKDKKYHKVRDHCHCRGEYIDTAHIICNLIYNVPKKFPIDFHIGSSYYYNFITESQKTIYLFRINQ